MANADPFVELKLRQREMWASFAPTAILTTPVAGQLVQFASVRVGERLLDVATGTGVVAVTAARAGARVKGLDLTPPLLETARENARLVGVDVEFTEGDAENLPYPDSSFDVVTSQFGHMFAPRPDVVVNEMRRVLKPGGRVVFATWPPEHFVGRMFMFVGRHSPPPPAGAAAPPQWGTPQIVTERLAPHFHPPYFSRGIMTVPALSPTHLRLFLEQSVGPMQKMVEALTPDAAKLASARAEFEALVSEYFEHNTVRQDFLLTRAVAK